MNGVRMRRLTIHIITVIYNRKIEEIVSLRQFERLVRHRPEVELIIADNSTVGSILEQNELAAVKRGWLRYIGCGGNIGLSRAYNLAIASIAEESPYWVMLADDDTFFSMEYLERACRQVHVEEALRLETDLGSARRERLRVLCGVVLTGDTGNRFLSPRSEHAKELAFFGMLRPPKPGIYQDLYPINSGLFLEGSAIREAGGFDERLFLDQVDYLMMDRLRAHGIRRIGIVPGLIRQSFSGDLRKAFAKDGQKEPTGKGNRDRIFRKDFQTYCELTGKPWYYRSFILGRRRLMLTAKHLLG
jgi:GT2 family glycosyltransferase